jgi:gas vesicle protein
MARKIQWRKILSIQDVGDIVAMTSSLRKVLGRKGREFEHRGEQAANRLRHDVEDSQAFEDITNMLDRMVKIIARKRREFERKGQETVEHIKSDIKSELADRPIVDSVEQTASKVRDTIDQKSYEVAKQLVERHEERHRQNSAEAGLFVVGALLGSLIGAIAAFWFAPQSGEETRREIQDRADDLREDIEQVTNEARRRVEGESIDEAMQYGKAEARKFQETARYR